MRRGSASHRPGGRASSSESGSTGKRRRSKEPSVNPPTPLSPGRQAPPRSATPASVLNAHTLVEILFRNGNLTLALAGWWWLLWAGSGCGRAPGWCGWAVVSLLRRCCGGAVCWQQAISLPAQSVVVGEVGQCVGVRRWRAVGGVGVLRTGTVAAGVRVYSSVSHL